LLRLIVLFTCLVGAQVAVAEPVRLDGDALKATVTGSVVEIDTPLGTTVPIRFNSDGLMSGEAGELASLLGSPKDRGRWWISDNKLCAKWFRWFEAQPHCITISLDGTRIFWQKDDGETGTATLVEQGNGGSAKPPSQMVTASAGEQAGKAQALGGLPPANPAQKFVTANAAAEPSSPGTTEAKPDAAPGPQTSSVAAPSMYPVKENLLPTRRIAQPKAPAQKPAQRPPVQAERHAPAPVADDQKVAQASSISMRAPTPQKPTPPWAQPLSFKVAGVQDYDVLYIRSGPSQDHTSVGMIPPTGRGIVITGRCRDDWCPIRHRNVAGWVNRYYLAEDSAR
jgi:hypothetical protein